MLDNLWYILLIIFGFGFLIMVHELGHFLVARYFKVRCPYFAIGMGVMGQMPPVVAWRKNIGWRFMKGTDNEWGEQCLKRIADERGVAKEELVIVEMLENPEDLAKVPTNCRVKRAELFDAGDELGLGETEYRLMALPLGGYVAMEGQEDMDPSAQSEDPRAFNNQPIYARTAILSAGVVMNVIFGFLFFIIAFGMGVDFPAPVVGAAAEGKPAATTYATGHDGDPAYLGLQPGDRVLSVDGQPVREFQELVMHVALGKPGKVLDFKVQRPGIEEPLTYALTPVKDPNMERLMSVGIAPAPKLEVGSVLEEPFGGLSNDAFAAGVTPGMRLSAMNGQDIPDFSRAMRWAKQNASSQSVEMTFADVASGESVTLTANPVPTLAQPVATDDADSAVLPGFLGLSPAIRMAPQDKSPAQAAGIEGGDIAVRVGDRYWPSGVSDFQQALKDGGPVEVQVMRGGEVLDLSVVPKKNKLGVSLDSTYDTPRISRPVDGTPAATAGVPSGSLIVSVGGQPVANWAQVQDAFQTMVATDAESVAVVVQPFNTEEEPLVVSLPITQADREAIAAARFSVLGGLPYLGLDLAQDNVTVKANGAADAMTIGMSRVRHAGQQVYVTLMRLFQGSVGVKNLRGPVGIVDAGRTIAAKGWSWFLYFLGLISINLAVLNFLPLPIVDGGHIVMLGYEKLRGKPASVKVQQALFIAGLALLGTLFLTVTYHDLARLFFG